MILIEMRKKIEAREQKLNDLTMKIIEGRSRPTNERSKKKGDAPITEGDGAPSKAAIVSRGEEQKSFGQNIMSRWLSLILLFYLHVGIRDITNQNTFYRPFELVNFTSISR